jgi:chromosome segregation ATPase
MVILALLSSKLGSVSMFSTLKLRLQSFIPDETRLEQLVRSEPAAEDAQVSQMRRMLAELRAGEAEASERREPPEYSPEFDEALAAARRFTAEHRQTAEALLREVCSLEERIKTQALAAQALREYSAVKTKADAAAIEEHRAQELARAASQRHRASVRQRKENDESVARARVDVQSAKAHVAEVEQRLRDAQRRTAELASTLEQCEAQVKELTAKEGAAASEAAEAEEHVSACRATCAEVQKELQAAEESAQAVKGEIPAGTQGFAGITDVHDLAARIAEASAALTTGSHEDATL